MLLSRLVGVQVYSLTVFVALCIGNNQPPSLESIMVLDTMMKEQIVSMQEEFQELFLSFNSVIETFGENHLGTVYS